MNIGLVNKPKGPGATQRVWEIAEALTRTQGRMARRKEVVDAYVAEGGNANTASTQYYYWKVAQGDDAATSVRGSAQVPGPDDILRLDVAADGTLRLPVGVLRGLELHGGGVLSGRLVNGQLVLVEPLVALRRVQEALGPTAELLRAEGRSLVDELIADRRADAGRGG